MQRAIKVAQMCGQDANLIHITQILDFVRYTLVLKFKKRYFITSKTLVKQSFLGISVNKKSSYKHTCVIYPPMPIVHCNCKTAINIFLIFLFASFLFYGQKCIPGFKFVTKHAVPKRLSILLTKTSVRERNALVY